MARGIVAGVGAGLIAAFLMNEFQTLWKAMASEQSCGETTNDRDTYDKGGAMKATQAELSDQPIPAATTLRRV